MHRETSGWLQELRGKSRSMLLWTASPRYRRQWLAMIILNACILCDRGVADFLGCRKIFGGKLDFMAMGDFEWRAGANLGI